MNFIFNSSLWNSSNIQYSLRTTIRTVGERPTQRAQLLSYYSIPHLDSRFESEGSVSYYGTYVTIQMCVAHCLVQMYQSVVLKGLVMMCRRQSHTACKHPAMGDTESSTIMSDLTDKSLTGPNGL